MTLYLITGNFENPGDPPNYPLVIQEGYSAYDTLGNQIDVIQSGEQHQITSNGGPIAIRDGGIEGDYTNQFSVKILCKAVGGPRRVSMKMSYEVQDHLNSIAFCVGSTYRGQGSFRSLLNDIAQGKVRVSKGRPKAAHHELGILP